LAQSVVVFVVACGTAAAVDLCVVDCVQRTRCATSSENKLVRSAGKHTNSTAAQSVAICAYTSSVRDDLVVTTGVAIALAVQKFIRLALADTDGALWDFASRAAAALIAIVD